LRGASANRKRELAFARSRTRRKRSTEAQPSFANIAPVNKTPGLFPIHRDGIVHGVRARLLIIPRRPITDRQSLPGKYKSGMENEAAGGRKDDRKMESG